MSASKTVVRGAMVVAAMTLVACSGAGPEPEPMPTSPDLPERSSDGPTSDAPSSGEPGVPLEATTTPAPTSSAPAPAPTTTTTTPAPPLDLLKITIDGVDLTIDSRGGIGPTTASSFFGVKYHGTGFASGSDVILDYTKIGKGCQSGANFLTLRPKGDAQYMPAGALGGAFDAACGLTVQAVPSALGDRLKLVFDGTLTSINVTPAKKHHVKIEVDLPRTI